MRNVAKESAITPWTILLTFFGIQTLCVAVILSDPDRGAEMFQRFGSLVVCASVFFVGIARVSLDHWERHWIARLKRNHEFWEKRNKELEKTLAEKFGEDDPYVNSTREENAVFLASQDPENLQSEFDTVRARLVFTDMAMLLFGTVQWGFGDIVYTWIFS